MAKLTVAGAVFFGGVCIYKSNERFYSNIVMPVVRLTPPEFVHDIGIRCMKLNMFGKPNFNDPDSLRTNFLGMEFSNPIGIAAGFDKQGEAMIGLESIGFGHVEVGSITPNAQPGNAKPRVFRLNEDKAIVNRYGFNSEGHEVVYNRIKKLRESGKFKGILGINLGKNKHTNNAIEDYVKGIKLFGAVADYLVVNISSPNTPGLRNMQEKNTLQVLLSEIINARSTLPKNEQKPILLKLAPDLSLDDIEEIVEVIQKDECKVDGLIISNTTIDRAPSLKSVNAAQLGGLSGVPLRSKSTKMIATVYNLTEGKVPIIGVGGVFSGEDAYEKILAGASIIQLYTSFIYYGPPIVTRVKKDLAKILQENGYENVRDAIGKGAIKFL